jgi:hypothetical protein
MALLVVLAQWVLLKAINRKRDEQYGNPNLYTAEMRRAEADRGDQASFFRYTI